jgi:hypothetical protein
MEKHGPALTAANSAFVEAITELGDRVARRVMRHRERYIKAWIAATGLHPTECEVIEEVFPMSADGVIRTRVYCRARSR